MKVNFPVCEHTKVQVYLSTLGFSMSFLVASRYEPYPY